MKLNWLFAIGKQGSEIAVAEAAGHVYGYAVGIDLTRRDLQKTAKDSGRPWETAKSFDHSAPISAIHPKKLTGVLDRANIWLTVNGQERQQGNIADMIWNVDEVIAELSSLFLLQPGDLIFHRHTSRCRRR